MPDSRTDVTADARVDVASVRASPPTLRRASTARNIGRYVIVCILAFCGYNAALEAWGEARDIVTHAPEPMPGILLFQGAVVITSALSAIGTWRRTTWAPRAVLVWGAVSATFVALLQPMLGLPRDALPGLLAGTAMLLAMTAGFVVFLRRDTTSTSASAAPVHDRKERM